MTWADILGHDRVVEQFRRAASRGRLASTFLFAGPAGIGKRTFAVKLAAALLCEANDEAALQPCGECDACHQVAAGTHPDLETVNKPADKQSIPLDAFIGDKEHRNREGLCHRISLKPVRGRRKVAIIDDADHLNVEGANCLLKTLEEPPPGSIIVLVGTSEQRQLPTIRSRCQIIRFRPLTSQQVETILLDRGLVESPVEASELAALSDGSLAAALSLADPELRGFRQHLMESLAAKRPDAASLVAGISSFVDAAGKEAPLRRARLKQLIDWVADFYRDQLRTHPQADGPFDPEQTAARLDRCLDATTQVNANANQATLIECWVDDLLQV